MRTVLLLAMLLTLPTLMLAHRSYFLLHDQPQLLEKVRTALDDPAFGDVAKDGVTMNHMDVMLQGFVETPERREEARKKVAAIHGVRCREEDNHLRIPARLAAKMENDTLTLSGWLPNAAVVHDVTQWLAQNRPGLKVDTSGVKLSTWVMHPEAPTVDPLPTIYEETWNAVRTKATLTVEKVEGGISVSGTLPSAELREAVVASLAGEKKTVQVKDKGLKTGPFVKTAHFAQAEALPAFLQDFFQSPGSEFFEADGDVVRLRGVATSEMAARWHALLQPLTDSQEVTEDLKIYPTRFHFPNYVPESKLPPQVMATLREALKPAVFHFDPNYFYLQAAEVPKFNAVSQAIVAAGHDARIIVGGYSETEGDPKAQQAATVRRCETVIAEFKDRGLPTAEFEMTIYSPAAVPNGADNRRVVELLLK
jgi:outer membrane protein OmpA-like peptidoglycan-associated protein